jgi:ribosomal protein L11 methylase PrmA
MGFNNPNMLGVIIEELLTHRFGFLIYRPFIEFINPEDNEKVIDFGCSSGSFAKLMTKK